MAQICHHDYDKECEKHVSNIYINIGEVLCK